MFAISLAGDTKTADLGIVMTKEYVETNKVQIHLELTNYGPDTALKAIVRDKIPPHLDYLTHCGDGVYRRDDGAWLIRDIQAGEKRVLKITVAITSPVNIINQAKIYKSKPIDNNRSNNSARVVVQGDQNANNSSGISTPLNLILDD